jgi:hypothetical protein
VKGAGRGGFAVSPRHPHYPLPCGRGGAGGGVCEIWRVDVKGSVLHASPFSNRLSNAGTLATRHWRQAGRVGRASLARGRRSFQTGVMHGCAIDLLRRPWWLEPRGCGRVRHAHPPCQPARPAAEAAGSYSHARRRGLPDAGLPPPQPRASAPQPTAVAHARTAKGCSAPPPNLPAVGKRSSERAIIHTAAPRSGRAAPRCGRARFRRTAPPP